MRMDWQTSSQADRQYGWTLLAQEESTKKGEHCPRKNSCCNNVRWAHSFPHSWMDCSLRSHSCRHFAPIAVSRQMESGRGWNSWVGYSHQCYVHMQLQASIHPDISAITNYHLLPLQFRVSQKLYIPCTAHAYNMLQIHNALLEDHVSTILYINYYFKLSASQDTVPL